VIAVRSGQVAGGFAAWTLVRGPSDTSYREVDIGKLVDFPLTGARFLLGSTWPGGSPALYFDGYGTANTPQLFQLYLQLWAAGGVDRTPLPVLAAPAP
jgi:hypothetical protein